MYDTIAGHGCGVGGVYPFFHCRIRDTIQVLRYTFFWHYCLWMPGLLEQMSSGCRWCFSAWTGHGGARFQITGFSRDTVSYLASSHKKNNTRAFCTPPRRPFLIVSFIGFALSFCKLKISCCLSKHTINSINILNRLGASENKKGSTLPYRTINTICTISISTICSMCAWCSWRCEGKPTVGRELILFPD